MARVIRARRLLELKIVYYGAGLCGKTTNLARLHSRFPVERRGEMIQLDTEFERTLFFDYFPANVGTINGYEVRFDLFTVPGQSFYNLTRRVVLDAVDGIVFVADSSPAREEANRDSLDNLVENLATYGRDLADLPLVFQWNKRDVRGALPVPLLEKTLNPDGRPSFEAVATEDVGVWETQAAILARVIHRIRSQAGASSA